MVRAIMIVEIAGRPAAHVKETLGKHVGVLNQIEDVIVHSMEINEPKEIEGAKDVFTCFSEIDFEVPTFHRLSEVVFDFMPSSIEVIEPAKVTLSVQESTNLLNTISGKIHKYDEIAKMAHFRINQLTAQNEELKKVVEENKVGKKSGKKVSDKTKKTKGKKKNN